MAELMIAVVILGIGLLITSSMFPIAWLKARDVAEMTALPACTEAADIHMRMLMQASSQADYSTANPPPVITSLFPGDWVAPPPPADQRYRAAIYPDMRVHHLNTGNYLAADLTPADGLPDDKEPNWLDFSSSDKFPVADNTWTLDEVVPDLYADSAARGAMSVLHMARLAPHVRMYPPLENAPVTGASAQEKALWVERLENRRYVWSVFYRLTELPGPDLRLRHDCQVSGNCDDPDLKEHLNSLTDSSLRKSRHVNVYYFTLKRPANARYARQEGANPTSNLSWDASRRTDAPRALPTEFDVLLPVPWRIEATITDATLPDCSRFTDMNDNNNDNPARTGIPTEIEIDDMTISDIVQQGTYLLDDRTGEVFRVSSRKNVTGDPTKASLILDKEYDPRDLCLAAEFNPQPPTVDDNYLNLAAFVDCVQDANGNIEGECNVSGRNFVEDEPERRFYWVFPPPIEAGRGPNGVPIFNGSQPVVGVEVRQMMIDPSL